MYLVGPYYAGPKSTPAHITPALIPPRTNFDLPPFRAASNARKKARFLIYNNNYFVLNVLNVFWRYIFILRFDGSSFFDLFVWLDIIVTTVIRTLTWSNDFIVYFLLPPFKVIQSTLSILNSLRIFQKFSNYTKFGIKEVFS